jgi:hypothetical protein
MDPGDEQRGVLIGTADEIYVYGWIGWEAASPFNGDYELTLSLFGEADHHLMSGNWQLNLDEARGRWDAWSDDHNILAYADNSMTVASPASAKNVISVGAYTTRNSWENRDGEPVEKTYAEGPIAPFSSRGPTRDGRSKPDVAAAGAWIISAASFSARYYLDDIVSGYHVAMPGTSMASPHVAGAVALLMSHEGGSALDAAEIKQILELGARTDAYTSAQPDPNTYGAGKLDVEGALWEWDQGPATPAADTPTPTATRATPTATGESATPTVTIRPPGPTSTATIGAPTRSPTPTGTPRIPGAGCWDHGGALAQSVVDSLDDGTPVHAGRYSALLGDPSLGPAGSGGGTVPIGSAWVEQSVRVPDTAAPTLSFWYRMVSYDVAQDSLRNVWDIFGLYVDGELTFFDGNQSGGTPGSRYEIGWRSETVDMAPWRGQTVTLRFANWNGHDGINGSEKHNTWTYLDDVYLLP